MPSGILVSQWIIGDIAIPVEVLRVGIPRHDAIRADELVNIRRKRPSTNGKNKYYVGERVGIIRWIRFFRVEKG
jgi:hypothetical protein